MDRQQQYHSVLNAIPDHVFIFDEDGTYVDVYGGEECSARVDCKSYVGKTIDAVSPPHLSKLFLNYIQTTLDTQQTQVFKYKLSDGEVSDSLDDFWQKETIWFEGTIKPLPLDHKGKRTVLWLARNITRQQQLEFKLKRLSEIDELTGVYNRRAFAKSLRSTLTQHISLNNPFSLIMLDIDHFKRVNDTYGHSTGDEVIQHVVHTLKSSLNHQCVMGRIGGEEFAIIVRETNLTRTVEVAEAMRRQLERKPFQSSSGEIKVTVSLGVTEVVNADEDIKTILSRADKAMYRAKLSGRNQVQTYQEPLESPIANAL